VNRYRKYIPIIAVVLVALGFNLDRFGIDLEALSRGAPLSQVTQPANGHSGNALSSNQSQSDRNQHSSADKWSSTRPEINLWHVFDGEINRKGKPVGYHSRPGGQDAPNARIKSIKDRPNSVGVYTANIEIRDGNQWLGKFSSFFPDNMSREDVVDAILNAYNNSNNKNAQPWRGPSGLGFTIQGYTTSRGINTAFPVFTR